ncbi:MAG: hypothetical protein GC160_02730 [Acidobacteria bacterium]|nr:hypothetical protein [Acidobacteriota bacterium]
MLILAAAAAQAQTTWRGLRFGMSEAEAKQALPDLHPVEEPATEGGESAALTGPVDIGGCAGTAFVWFSDDRLSRVSIDVREVDDCGSTAPRHKYRHEVRDAFKEKYGKPAAVKTAFGGAPKVTVWRTDEQLIELRDVGDKLWTATYRPIPADF